MNESDIRKIVRQELQAIFNPPKPKPKRGITLIDVMVGVVVTAGDKVMAVQDIINLFDETVKVKRLSDRAIVPSYAHQGDAGLDLYSVVDLVIEPGESALVGTGIAIELPLFTEAQIRPRSGLALKHQITVLNSPGTVDQSFRGEVGVILINHGKFPFVVSVGDRVAQMVIKPVLQVKVVEVSELDSTARGEGGFGSTGV